MHDIVLFFAVFHLPQKKRQYLKIQLLQTKENKTPTLLLAMQNYGMLYSHSSAHSVSAPKGADPFKGSRSSSAKETVTNPSADISMWIPSQLYISNKCAKHVLETYIFETEAQKKLLTHGNIKNLPLYGQTLLVACRREEQAKELYQYTSSLAHTYLLGGFYKNTCKTREFLQAALDAASKKVEIYKGFLRVLSLQNSKLVRATGASNRQLLVLMSQLHPKGYCGQ